MLNFFKKKNDKPRSVKIFCMRHGNTEYREEFGKGSHEETGKWKPEIDDLTKLGKTVVEKSITKICEEIDPKKEVVILVSSPRARAITTSEVVEHYLEKVGIEYFSEFEHEKPFILGQYLRSSGDFAPIYDEQTDGDREDSEDKLTVPKKIWEERQEQSTGWRIVEFLMAMAVFLPDYFNDPRTVAKFSNKWPVFILVTHNEVVADLIDKLNIYKFDRDRGALPKGKYIEFICDLDDPTHMVVLPGNVIESDPVDVYFDFFKGKIFNPDGGEIEFNTEHVQAKDERALGGILGGV